MHRHPCPLPALIGLSVALLGACTSYEIAGRVDRLGGPLEPNSMHIVWSKNKPESLVTKHERGYGLQKPTITAEDQQKLSVTRKQVFFELGNKLVPKLKTALSPYIREGGEAKTILKLELNRIAIDTDGSRDITLTATLSQPPSSIDSWSRKIQIYAPRFGSDETISTSIVEAVVGQLRSSALVP